MEKDTNSSVQIQIINFRSSDAVPWDLWDYAGKFNGSEALVDPQDFGSIRRLIQKIQKIADP